MYILLLPHTQYTYKKKVFHFQKKGSWENSVADLHYKKNVKGSSYG